MESGTAAATLLDRRATPRARDRGASLSIRLSAVIVAATVDEPRVLTVRFGQEPVEALPSGPLEVEHRTLEVGLRAWVERQTSQKLGYVEQLYTFGDRDRIESQDTLAGRALTVAYLALVREARPGGAAEALWQSWYRHFPWEDWREGEPPTLAPLRDRLGRWAELRSGVDPRGLARSRPPHRRGRRPGFRGADGGRPPPDPRHRDWAAARQNQISSGGV